MKAQEEEVEEEVSAADWWKRDDEAITTTTTTTTSTTTTSSSSTKLQDQPNCKISHRIFYFSSFGLKSGARQLGEGEQRSAVQKNRKIIKPN